jgi:Tfp pilus assembly protein PilF
MTVLAGVILLAATLQAASWTDQLDQADRLRASGQTVQAEQLYGEIVAGAEGLLPVDLNTLGTALFRQPRYGDAESLFRKALAAWDRTGGGLALNRALIQENLGAALRAEDRYKEAEALLLDSLRQIESGTAPGSVEAGHAASNLAALYLMWGDPLKAESYALQAAAVLGGTGDDGTRDRRNNQLLLASIYVQQRHFQDATALLEELVKTEDHLAPGAYKDLAEVALDQHRWMDAETLARRGLEIAGRTLPASHPDRAAILNSLAQACRYEGKYMEAEEYYREAIAAWAASVGAGQPTTAKGYFNLAGFYHERGREMGAEQLYRRAAEVFDSAYGANDLMTLVARNELAEVLRAEGRYTESDNLSRSTLATLERILGPEDDRVARALANRARLLESTKHPQEAASLRERIQGMAPGYQQP